MTRDAENTSVHQETAASVNETMYVENGGRVYPCRCGQTHRGDYAVEEWNHHNCFHDEPLLSINDLAPMLCCGLCGKVFHVREVAS